MGTPLDENDLESSILDGIYNDLSPVLCKRPLFISTQPNFQKWIMGATTNDRYVYFVGLSISETVNGCFIAHFAYSMFRIKLVHLFQKRVMSDGVITFNYIAVRSRTLYIPGTFKQVEDN